MSFVNSCEIDSNKIVRYCPDNLKSTFVTEMSEVPHSSVTDAQADVKEKKVDEKVLAVQGTSDEKTGEANPETREQKLDESGATTTDLDNTLDDSCVYMTDLMKEQEDTEMEALIVLGGSDENNCTYSKVSNFSRGSHFHNGYGLMIDFFRATSNVKLSTAVLLVSRNQKKTLKNVPAYVSLVL